MKVLIIYNEHNEVAALSAPQIITWLSGLGVQVVVAAHHEDDATHDLSDVSLAVSLGGDGTLLRAARLVAPYGIELLGLSYGNLGFLTGADAPQSFIALERALAGELHPQRRSMLEVEVSSIKRSDAEFGAHGLTSLSQETCQTHTFIGLNDVAIDRGARPRMLEYCLAINGVKLARQRGDGLVVSTASGSTGYALSAGGPIMAPDCTSLAVVPLATHGLAARPVIMGPSDVAEVTLIHQRPTDLRLYVDGVEQLQDRLLLSAIIRRSMHEVTLLEMTQNRFYTKVASTFFGTCCERITDGCQAHGDYIDVPGGYKDTSWDGQGDDEGYNGDHSEGISGIKRVWF